MALILLLMSVKFQWVSSVLSINGVSARVLSLHPPIHANNFRFFCQICVGILLPLLYFSAPNKDILGETSGACEASRE